MSRGFHLDISKPSSVLPKANHYHGYLERSVARRRFMSMHDFQRHHGSTNCDLPTFNVPEKLPTKSIPYGFK